MFCPNCGELIQEGKAFCRNCGAPVPKPAAPASLAETVIQPRATYAARAPGAPPADGISASPRPSTPLSPSSPPPPPSPAYSAPFSTPPPVPAAPLWQPPAEPAGRKSRTGLILGIVAAVIVVLAGAGVGSYFAFFRDGDSGVAVSTTAVGSASTTLGDTAVTVSTTEAVTVTTGGQTGTTGPGGTTAQTVPGLNTSSTTGTVTTDAAADPPEAYLMASDNILVELRYDDTRIPELAAKINSTAPAVPDWVRDELSTMLGTLDALNVELASLDVPAGFDDSHYWLEEAVRHMGGRIDATIQGIEAIWDAGRVSERANDFFDLGRAERDACREALRKYDEFLPID